MQSMAVTQKSRKSRRGKKPVTVSNYPDRIHLLHNFKDDVREAAKSFNLPVFELEENNNEKLIPQKNTIYVVDDFETGDLLESIQHTAYTWILGPTALIELANNPSLSFKTKPLYTTCMNGLCFLVSCHRNISVQLRMVKLIQWMGGKLSQDAGLKVTHMITSTTIGGDYRYCSTFNVPILTPDWVEACWALRNNSGFIAVEIQGKFKIPAFAGMNISLEGFTASEEMDISRYIKEHGGNTVSSQDSSCTHIVGADGVDISNISSHGCYRVSADWLSACITYGERVDEDQYKYVFKSEKNLSFSPRKFEDEDELPIKRTSLGPFKRQSLLAPLIEEHNNHLNVSGDKSKKICEVNTSFVEVQDDKITPDASNSNADNYDGEDGDINEIIIAKELKKKNIMGELYQTEINYVYSLNHLMQIQKMSIDDSTAEGPILNQTESKMIFGNLDKISSIHKILCVKMYGCLNDFNVGLKILEAFNEVKEEMLKEYVDYSLNIEESRNTLKECESNNLRFQKILKKYSRNKEEVIDLLIRPIQRLASMKILLNEMKKNTPDSSNDKEALKEAIQVLHNILNSMDSDKSRVDRMKKMFDIYQTIDKCPPELVSAQRRFILQFSAQELITKNQQHVLGSSLIFFLFDDILEIVKVRSKYQNQMKVFNSDKKEKPYKHLMMIPLFKILNILSFDHCSEGIFGLNIKDIKIENGNTVYCFQYSIYQVERLEDVLITFSKTLTTYDGLKTDFIFEGLALNNLYLEPLPSPSCKSYDVAVDVVQKTCMLFSKTGKTKKVKRRSYSCGDITQLDTVL